MTRALNHNHQSAALPTAARAVETSCALFKARKIKSGENKGLIGDGRCWKFVRRERALFGGRAPVLKIPPNTASCRHFEEKGA